jgi:hypothetical protein
MILKIDIPNNLFLPIVVSIITGIGILLRKKIAQLINQWQKRIISIELSVDKIGNLKLEQKQKFNSKINLIKQHIRNRDYDKFTIKIKPNFRVKGLDKYEKAEYKLRLQKKSNELKDKLIILFFREVDIRLERDMGFVCDIFENIIKTQNPNVTGKTKLDIYRTSTPKICFSIWLDNKDFEDISKKQELSTDELKQKLSIPTMTSMTIFDDNMYSKYIYPAFIWEINRLKNNHKFDLETNHWDSLILYEVGLG